MAVASWLCNRKWGGEEKQQTACLICSDNPFLYIELWCSSGETLSIQIHLEAGLTASAVQFHKRTHIAIIFQNQKRKEAKMYNIFPVWGNSVEKKTTRIIL